MKAALFLSTLLAAASAFTAPMAAKPSTALSSSLDGAIGLTVETGRKCPPLGAKILEGTGPEALAWFENAELKHGRIAMVATIGFMVQKYGVHFPLYLGPSGSNVFHPTVTSGDWMLSSSSGVTFSDIAAAAPLDAVKMVPAGGWLQILFVAGWFECVAYQRQYNEGGRVPGDYGYDPLGFTKREGGLDSPQLKSLRVKEIKNGRIAMLAISGWVANEVIPGALPVWHP
jgi:hypothetical protein